MGKIFRSILRHSFFSCSSVSIMGGGTTILMPYLWGKTTCSESDPMSFSCKEPFSTDIVKDVQEGGGAVKLTLW